MASDTKPRLLTIVLLPMETKDSNEEDSKHYTTMRFPKSYKDAVDTAFKAFVLHIPANATPTDFEILCPVVNNQKKLVWSTFDTADWDLIVEEVAGHILGIRRKGTHGETQRAKAVSFESPGLDEDPFVVGSVGLTYGAFKEGTTDWSRVSTQFDTSLSPKINRPKSYLEAIEIIMTVGSSGLLKSSLFGEPSFDGSVDPDVQLRFHKFTSHRKGKPTTDCWVDFPEEAYQNNKIWREFVPRPFEILGFTLQRRRSVATSTDGTVLNP